MKIQTVKIKGWGKLVNLVSAFLLIGIGFVYLYPILYMAVVSVMPTSDLINPTIQWLPTALDFGSFSLVSNIMEYPKTLVNTLLLASVCAAVSTLVCCLVGYALARYPVPGKNCGHLFCCLCLLFRRMWLQCRDMCYLRSFIW